MQIHSNSSTVRNQICKGIILAIRQLARQEKPDNDLTKDLIAFIIASLKSLSQLNEKTLSAWEKRDYWVKADRFRREWLWVETEPEKLETILFDKQWEKTIPIILKITQSLNKIEVSDHHRLGTPWVGAYQKWIQEQNKDKKTKKC